MASIAEIEAEIIDEFDQFEDQMDKYEYIIEQGRLLPAYPEEYRTEDFIVKGCQSKVWMRAQIVDGLVHIQVDSNTAITKGLAALLWRVLSGQKPQDIVNAKLEFIDKTDLHSHLSSQRSNGLSAMIIKIKNYAGLYLNH